MIDDIVFNTQDNTIFETQAITPGIMDGYSFDGNQFDFTVGTLNITVFGEIAHPILN